MHPPSGHARSDPHYHRKRYCPQSGIAETQIQRFTKPHESTHLVGVLDALDTLLDVRDHFLLKDFRGVALPPKNNPRQCSTRSEDVASMT